MDTSDRPEGYGYTGGGGSDAGGRSGIRAIDIHTGQMKWMHEGGGPQGLLTTAGESQSRVRRPWRKTSEG